MLSVHCVVGSWHTCVQSSHFLYCFRRLIQRPSDSYGPSHSLSNMVHARHRRLRSRYGNRWLGRQTDDSAKAVGLQDAEYYTVCLFFERISFRSDLDGRFTLIIVAPTPILAANFVTLGRVIRVIGEPFSRLRPRLCACAGFVDFLSD